MTNKKTWTVNQYKKSLDKINLENLEIFSKIIKIVELAEEIRDPNIIYARKDANLYPLEHEPFYNCINIPVSKFTDKGLTDTEVLNILWNKFCKEYLILSDEQGDEEGGIPSIWENNSILIESPFAKNPYKSNFLNFKKALLETATSKKQGSNKIQKIFNKITLEDDNLFWQNHKIPVQRGQREMTKFLLAEAREYRGEKLIKNGYPTNRNILQKKGGYTNESSWRDALNKLRRKLKEANFPVKIISETKNHYILEIHYPKK